VEIREFSNSLISLISVNVDPLLHEQQLDMPCLATSASEWDWVHRRVIIRDHEKHIYKSSCVGSIGEGGAQTDQI
jgi:hypothetical protein